MMRQDRVRFGTRVVALLLVGALSLGAGGRAEDARFASLTPAGDGHWRAELTGVKAGATLRFEVDGVEIQARVEVVAGRTVADLVVPTAGRRLTVSLAAGKPPSAALRLVAASPGEAPLADGAIYHIMVEMFRDGSAANDSEITGWRHPRYAGGDLQGVLEKVDYLRDLGVTAVWLSPIFAANTSHGYDVRNYFQVGGAVAVPGDPRASLDLFHRLVEALHQRGMRVILDLPLNHASKNYDRKLGDPKGFHPRATGPKQDAEKIWESWGSGYQYWDFDHAPTRQFLIDAATYWVAEQGVDGLRLDYVRGGPHDFWSELNAALQAAKPGLYVVGEAWQDDRGAESNLADIASYYSPVGGKAQLPSLLDFPLQQVMTEVFARGGPAEDLETWLQRSAAAYGADAWPTYFLDNHDLTRFADWAGDPDRLVAAVSFLVTLPGPIALFYGTETGLSGSTAKPGFTDSGRIPMPWEALDAKLVERVRGVLAARKAHPVLARGARLPLFADRDALVMARLDGEETLLVGVNPGKASRVVSFAAGALTGEKASFELILGSPGAALPEPAGSGLRWALPPASTLVVRVVRR